jgi:hypothetical protein
MAESGEYSGAVFVKVDIDAVPSIAQVSLNRKNKNHSAQGTAYRLRNYGGYVAIV